MPVTETTMPAAHPDGSVPSDFLASARADHPVNRWSLILAGAAVAVAVILAYTQVYRPAALAALVIVAVAAWRVDVRKNIAAYLVLLGVQIPESAIAVRPALSDFFMLPLIARYVWDIGRYRRRSERTTLRGPLLALLCVMALSTAVTYVRTGHVGIYVLFNKDAGLVFLVLGFFALTQYIRTMRDVRQIVDWFVIGASVANVLALLAVALSLAGLDNQIYMSNGRLYGWLLNPSSWGTLVVTALLLELPRLGFERKENPRLFAIRWTNVFLLGVAALLTLSRSAWLSLMAGSATLLFLWLITRGRRRRVPLHQVMVGLMTTLTPAALLFWIAIVQWQNILAVGQDPAAIAKMQQDALVGQCLDPGTETSELCQSIPRSAIEVARKARASRSAPASTRGDTSGFNDGALMNARGIQARATINNIAWTAYVSSLATRLLGLGVGTFLDISAQDLGVRVIVHTTILWFLVEMGPLGLAVLLWLLWRTALNLWRTRLLPEWQGDLSHGVAAAVVAWFAYSLFNEAFYARHFWLLLLCADRLYMLSQLAAQPAE